MTLVLFIFVLYYSVIKELAGRDSSCINDGDEDSNTALHLAAIEGNVKVVQCLLVVGADVNVRYISILQFL